jgi:hypothetical protein
MISNRYDCGIKIKSHFTFFPLQPIIVLGGNDMPGSAVGITKTFHVRPDAKGRITLGKLAEGVSSFKVSEQPDGGYLLEPMVEIPAREKWLFKNKAALRSVKQGLSQSARGETRSRGSFAKYADGDK